VIAFDTDYDHPMESTLLGHPEHVMPFCVRNYRLTDGDGRLLYEKTGNYQSINAVRFAEPVVVKELVLWVEHPAECVPAAVLSVQCF
jgi:hypothetical protein